MSNVAVTVTPTPRGYSMCSCIRNSSLKAAAVVVGISVLMGGSRVQAGFLEGQTLSLEIQDTVFNPPTIYGPIQFVVNDTVEIGVSNTSPVVRFNMEVTEKTITFTYT
jgi:hypothetical protein